jgi:DNA gyrase/topoisomerase IV subunit A
MSAAELTRLVEALVMFVTAIGAVWAAIKSSKTNSKVETLGAEAHETAAIADTKLDTIHDLTNSNLSQVKTELELAKREIKDLHGVVSAIAAERPGAVPSSPALIVPTAPAEPPARAEGELP